MSVRRFAIAGALLGAVVAALVAAPLWRARDVYEYRRASAGAGDLSIMLGFPVVYGVVPIAFAFHRSGSGPDPENPGGLGTPEATAVTVFSIAGNWALWAAVVAVGLNGGRRRRAPAEGSASRPPT